MFILTFLSLRFNKDYLCNDHVNMEKRLGSYLPPAQYHDWGDMAIRNGIGAAQEYFYISQISDKLRDIKVTSHWVADESASPTSYYLSITMPPIPGHPSRATAFIRPEDEVEICLAPKPTGTDRLGNPLPDEEGWVATFAGTEFPHGGSHLIHVQDKYKAGERDPRVILSTQKWSLELLFKTSTSVIPRPQSLSRLVSMP